MRIHGQRFVLHFARLQIALQRFFRLQHGGSRLRALRRQFVMQAGCGVMRFNRAGGFIHHVAGVEAGRHFHNGDAGFSIAGCDGALNRRRAAPARQQGGVNIQAAVFRRVQHRLRQDQAVGRHHHHIRI